MLAALDVQLGHGVGGLASLRGSRRAATSRMSLLTKWMLKSLAFAAASPGAGAKLIFALRSSGVSPSVVVAACGEVDADARLREEARAPALLRVRRLDCPEARRVRRIHLHADGARALAALRNLPEEAVEDGDRVTGRGGVELGLEELAHLDADVCAQVQVDVLAPVRDRLVPRHRGGWQRSSRKRGDNHFTAASGGSAKRRLAACPALLAGELMQGESCKAQQEEGVTATPAPIMERRRCTSDCSASWATSSTARITPAQPNWTRRRRSVRRGHCFRGAQKLQLVMLLSPSCE